VIYAARPAQEPRAIRLVRDIRLVLTLFSIDPDIPPREAIVQPPQLKNDTQEAGD
jgi:hypothetical protein